MSCTCLPPIGSQSRPTSSYSSWREVQVKLKFLGEKIRGKVIPSARALPDFQPEESWAEVRRRNRG
jgi:hypothetical protein